MQRKVIKIIATLAKNRNEMRVERDIAGFSLPFAAGSAAAVFAGETPGTGYMFFSSAVIFAAGIFTIFLVACTGMRRKPVSTLAAAIFSAFICGIFTGMSGSMLACSTLADGSPFLNRLHSAAEATGRAIDALPFHSNDTNAIIKALLTGNRSGLTKEMQETFRSSGASHILALSGLHLGIIYTVIRKTLAFAGNHPAVSSIRSVLTVSICGLYTAATGAGPSITRAFLFILLGETARLTGRQRSMSGIMMAALTIQLAVSPLSAKHVGFQLSYAAMAGISFIYPVLKRFWNKETEYAGPGIPAVLRLPEKIWNSAAISISCQLTAGPVAYFYFGTFPINFLLTNLIAIPLAGAAIPAALLTLILSYAGIRPQFLLDMTEAAVDTMAASLGIIAEM